ncbi:MAG: type II toxin-antitoxin system death-on-curing family toxin [Candidatus Marinimicrobia bacterium]|nr:type II toxin-antitoxin system death-on-curing family toxin [Candidatus Neomarinimicrobiota bacterium]MBT4826968.1 type II toxin-antitoxin system death-on-curing family toxin [Candidatus Neomarinimicrobiota bacterium]MBT5759907.1 type II toxin-antitoxin system death-on-curing family toxin [Candidatus Neomarinimicrobiota bacterium]MBT6516378.1 type II toxin-antitoxin system death-on-curing family toxin [Candidatus Neomarinimicrobiota bacterium]MBT7515713.1 type II toxin-antitoxin system death
MSNAIIYFESIDEVIAIHKKTVEVSGGGEDGVRDTHSLIAALAHIQNDDYYPTFEAKLTHLFFVANKSHCFVDGNKRIAISLGMKFLLNNGYLYVIQKFAHQMEMVSYQVASNNIDKDLLLEIVDSIINEEDYSESLKIRIANCIKDVSIIT